MTVYIELVIFNNFAVDLLLEIATLTIFRKKIVWWRAVLAAVIGAGVATSYPLCPVGVQIAIKILLAPVMALVFDKVRDTKRKKDADKKKIMREVLAYIKRLFVFCVLTYFVGGVSYGLNFAFNIDVASYWQFGVVSLALLTLLITVRIIVLRFSKTARKICSAKLCVGESQIDVKALCDSGNCLTDSLSGLPVVILSSDAEKTLDVRAEMCEGYIEVKTVNGEGCMPILRLDRVEVKGREFKAYAALSHENYDDFEVILQNTMF